MLSHTCVTVADASKTPLFVRALSHEKRPPSSPCHRAREVLASADLYVISEWRYRSSERLDREKRNPIMIITARRLPDQQANFEPVQCRG